MRSIDRIKQKFKKLNKKSRLLIAAVAALVLAGTSFSVYAKYYKTGWRLLPVFTLAVNIWQRMRILKVLPWKKLQPATGIQL